MAQGHTVLPPYGSGLGRERAVFPDTTALARTTSQTPKRLSTCQSEHAVPLSE